MKTVYCLLILAFSCVSSIFSQNLDSLQKKYVAQKYGMFLHFNMGTFQVKQWADPGLDPNLFNPDSLDAGQWADAAKAAGMKYMVLTVKHHDGFCLWNSAYTTYDVGSSKWKNGKGDVVKEFADSCRSRGLAVGFYFSIWDRSHANDGDTSFIQNQLKELLTNYGPISLLWFDGWGWQIPYTTVPYLTVRNTIKSTQPNCLMVNNSQEHNLSRTDIVEWEKGGHQGTSIPDTNSMPSELCETIKANGNWFYDGAAPINDLYPAATLKGLLSACNSRNASFLLDVTPNQHGRIPLNQVARIKEIGFPVGVLQKIPTIQTEGKYRNVPYRILVLGKNGPRFSELNEKSEKSETWIDIRGRQFGESLQKIEIH